MTYQDLQLATNKIQISNSAGKIDLQNLKFQVKDDFNFQN